MTTRTISQRIFLLLALIAFLLPGVRAGASAPARDLSQCRLDVWTSKDGLPPQGIGGIAQSSDGFLWMTSGNGLIRFDGTSFQTFKRADTPGMPDDNIWEIQPRHEGGLWALCGGTIGVLDKGRFTVMHTVERGDLTGIDQFCLGTADDLWATSNHQILHIKDGHVTKGPTLPDIGGIVATGPDEAWVSTWDKGLYRYAQGRLTVYFRQPDGHATPGHIFPTIAASPDGSVWVGTADAGVLHFTQGHFTHYLAGQNGLRTNEIHGCYVGPSGLLWVTDRLGVECFAGGRFTPFDDRNNVFDGQAGGCLEDREHNLWVTLGSRLVRFADGKLGTFSLPSPQPGLIVNGMAAAPDGSYWFTTQGDGLAHYQNGKSTWYTKRDGLVSNTLCSVYCTADGTVWAYAADNTLVRVAKGKIQCFPSGRYIEAMTHDSQGPLFILYQPNQLCRLHGHQLVPMPVKLKNTSLIYTTAFADRRDCLWLGSGVGLERVWHGHDQLFADANTGALSLTNINTVLQDAQGGIWLLSYDGLIRVTDPYGDRPKFKLYDAKAGLTDCSFTQSLLDGQGRLWASAAGGIVSLSLADVDRYDQGKINRIPSTIYGPSDGLKEFPRIGGTEPRTLMTRDGQLWFKASRSVCIVDPKRLANTAPPADVRIDEASLNGAEVRPGGSSALRTPAGHGTLEIHYTVPSFAAPEKIRFHYRLVGADGGWVDVGTRRTAYFTNLPPGTYQFCVLACNSDGVWNPRTATLMVIIAPFAYQTWWFRLGCVLLALCTLALLVFGRLRALRRHNRELEAHVNERTEQLATMHEEVLAQNDDLRSIHAELEAQNQELTDAQTVMERQQEQLAQQARDMEERNRELQGVNERIFVTNMRLEEANRRLSSLATTDGLTGLTNHRSFQERLEQECAYARRYGTPLSLLLLDVDHFKQYNDTFGHPAGDDVLRLVGELLIINSRDTDCVARYGGEEFVVILPNTDRSGLYALAERFRATIAEHPWPKREITASFGAATFLEGGGPADAATLIAEADTALYRAKSGGRNRVAHAHEAATAVGV